MNTGFYKNLVDTRVALRRNKATMLGYPLNCASTVPWSQLFEFLEYPINNLGDPFVGSGCGLNTFNAEQEVIHWFAALWHLENPWGYVTNSGSEGNLRGVLMGREKLWNPRLIASTATHYSVWKAAQMLRLPVTKIKTDAYSRIDLEHLAYCLERDTSDVVVVLNAGTVMSGAVDNITGVCNLIQQHRHYIHVDAALNGLLGEESVFDFSQPIHSMSVSGHKMPGCPIPCGAFVAERKPRSYKREYISSIDTTINGSRDGWSVLALRLAIEHYGRNGFKEMADSCRLVAFCTFDALHKHEPLKAPESISVTFKRPSDWVCRKWQLAVEGDRAKIVCMPHVTRDMIDLFIRDLNLSKENPCEAPLFQCSLPARCCSQ